jgi:hypothetical protein
MPTLGVLIRFIMPVMEYFGCRNRMAETGSRNEERASSSLVWLIGWALAVPFAHPLRLSAYGLIPSTILIGLTVLFPDDSVFAPLLVSPNFTPRPFPQLVADDSVGSWTVSLITFLMTTVLLCIWQRDIMRGFRDPLGQLLIESFGRMTEYVILIALFAACFIGIRLSSGSAVTATVAAVMAGCFGRIAFLAPLIAHRGWRAAFAGIEDIGMGRIIGSLLVFALLGLVWIGLLFLGSEFAISSALTNGSHALILADVKNTIVSLILLLWLTATAALTVRVSVKPETPDATVFD